MKIESTVGYELLNLRQSKWQCMILIQNPTASSKSYWELGSQDTPQFPGLCKAHWMSTSFTLKNCLNLQLVATQCWCVPGSL